MQGETQERAYLQEAEKVVKKQLMPRVEEKKTRAPRRRPSTRPHLFLCDARLFFVRGANVAPLLALLSLSLSPFSPFRHVALEAPSSYYRAEVTAETFMRAQGPCLPCGVARRCRRRKTDHLELSHYSFSLTQGFFFGEMFPPPGGDSSQGRGESPPWGQVRNAGVAPERERRET